VVGIRLRRWDQLKPHMVLVVVGNVIQKNARFGLRDPLKVHLEHVRMPDGNGRVRTKGRSSVWFGRFQSGSEGSVWFGRLSLVRKVVDSGRVLGACSK